MPAAALAASEDLAGPRADGYTRHRPEASLLYQIVEEYWPEFRQRADEAGGLPRFVIREFESYLKCGILEHGLARLKCGRCGHEMVIGFSCKRRGFCPSCCGRRMDDVAAHLVDAVLPAEVRYRQWVCTVPWEWRTAIGYDRKLCADVLDAFASSLLRHIRWRVKRLFGLASVSDAQVGAITFVQRNDSALRLAPHFHTLAADGAWVRGEDGDLRFLALPEPTAEEVAQLATRVHVRLLRTLERHGRLGELSADEHVLASCYGAAAGDVQVLGADPGQRTQKVFGPVPVQVSATETPVAQVGGVNIHAATAVDGRDRRRLERLVRYMARPPVCTERLVLQDDGKVRYGFKSAWRDGTKAVVLSGLDFIARLCALVPPPRFHLVHYHGAFSGGSAARQDIVPGLPAPQQPKTPIPLFEQETDTLPAPSEPSRHPWSWLLARVFAVDILKCPVRSCPGEMKVVEVARTREHAARILAGLALGARPPTRRSRVPARQLALPFRH
ncbi:MAG: transposase [Candidatus Sericytochromatia bacterium]|nr:transposase [Candidatus Tanganyikabacteria bacterium]